MEGKPRDSWRKRQIKFLYFSLISVGLAYTLARLEVATTVMPHTVADPKAGAGALVVGANTAPKAGAAPPGASKKKDVNVAVLPKKERPRGW